MSYFLSKLLEADAKIKLGQRETEVEPGMPEEEIRHESGTGLVKIQLDRLETKIENIQRRLRVEDDDALRAIDEANLEGVKAEKEELESWLNET